MTARNSRDGLASEAAALLAEVRDLGGAITRDFAGIMRRFDLLDAGMAELKREAARFESILAASMARRAR